MVKFIKNIFAKVVIFIWKNLIGFVYKHRYQFQRIGIAIFTLCITSLLSFMLINAMPGDIIDSYSVELANQRRITIEEARKLAIQLLNYNPDASFFSNLGLYLSQLFKGNLGSSMYIDGLTANDIIKKSLPWTLFVATISLAISFALGTYFGTRMAWRRKGAGEAAMNTYIVVSSSIPDYLIGLLLLYIFSYQLSIFPNQGAYSLVAAEPSFSFAFIGSCLFHACLPIAANVIAQTGSWALMMKGSAVGVLGDDYVNAAIARGLSERIIVKKYLKRNAIVPLVTSLALSFALLFGGSPLMESIFNYPGIGQQFSIFIGRRDYFVVMGILIFISVIVIIVNLIADTIYSLIDPRIRRGV
jgi:peptide/nickel transport system permease protein